MLHHDQDARTAAAERWLPIAEFPDYEASDWGRVRSWRNSHGNKRAAPLVLKPQTMAGGYQMVSLYNENGCVHRLVHALVLEVFVGPCPDGMECRHAPDRTRSNNRLINLAWGTKLENAADKHRDGTTARGDAHYARTNPERLARGEHHGSRTRPESLARGERHGSRTRPDRVPRGDRNGRRTKPESYPRGERCARAKLTDEQAKEIVRAAGTHQSIALAYGVTRSMVGQIKSGRARSDALAAVLSEIEPGEEAAE